MACGLSSSLVVCRRRRVSNSRPLGEAFADLVAGAALGEPRSADFVAGAVLCALTLSLPHTLTLTHIHSHSPSRTHSHSSHSHSSHSLTLLTLE